MGLFRSEEMVHKKIRIPIESANEIMRALGLLKDSIEFEDLTKDDVEARKSFSDMIKRCDEMKKKITDYSKVCYDFQYPIQNYNSYEDFSKDLRDDMQNRDKKFGSTYFDLVENEILENERKINELVDSHTQIREDLITLIEKKYVFKKAQELVRSNVNFSGISNLNFLIGVVPVENEMKMKRMLFRISRGRALTAFYSLEISSDEYKLTSKVRQRNADFIENQNTYCRAHGLNAIIWGILYVIIFVLITIVALILGLIGGTVATAFNAIINIILGLIFLAIWCFNWIMAILRAGSQEFWGPIPPLTDFIISKASV